jgi:hypothetical protein
VAEEDSETPYLTRRFMDFVNERQDDTPWMCHLSFIKPHWPYIVPEPYHNMYGPETWLPPVRNDAEKNAPHPVLGAFMNSRVSQSFARDEVRETVLPAYMGLIKQIDDQMGHLFAFMKSAWPKKIRTNHCRIADPSCKRIARSFSNLELNRLFGFTLQNGCPFFDTSSYINIRNY